MSEPADTFTCPICNEAHPVADLILAQAVRSRVITLIRRDHPRWPASGPLCTACLRRYRAQYVEHVLKVERGELTRLEHDVIQSLREHEVLARNLNAEFEKDVSLGARLADRVASFGGSWRFILAFGAVLLVWIVINVVAGSTRAFDPYPFILLNLILSCLAAIQAPIIMMSQNRQEAKDRLRAEHDYRVNLKAELEIRHLNLKMDQLLTHQWSHLLEIQKIQVELMEELARRKPAT